MPPTRPRAICRIAAACFSSSNRNSYLVANRSPVATGMVVMLATRAISSTFSGGTGSSNQSGSNCSIRRAKRSAPEVVVWPWGTDQNLATATHGLTHATHHGPVGLAARRPSPGRRRGAGWTAGADQARRSRQRGNPRRAVLGAVLRRPCGVPREPRDEASLPVRRWPGNRGAPG